MYRVHRWLSLALFVWIVLESVTGAVLVFAPEIDRWSNPGAYETTDGDLGLDVAVEVAQDSRPDEPVQSISTPGFDGPNYVIVTVDETGHGHRVLVDPGSGEVNASDHHEPGWVLLFERLHFDLNSTSIFGFSSLTVVGWLGIGWLLILCSGFTVWYRPRIKRWTNALRVRRNRGRVNFNIELHNAIGMAVLVPLTLIVMTGINFSFPEQVNDVYSFVTFGYYEEPSTEAALSEPDGREPITAGEAMDVVEGIDSEIGEAYVATPSGSPVGVYAVYANVDGSYLGLVAGEHEVQFDVDQYSGRVIRISDPLDDNAATQAYDEWSYPLHTGTFGGTITRVLWFVVGLAQLMLVWTGVLVWWLHRRGRARPPEPAEPAESSVADPAPETVESS